MNYREIIKNLARGVTASASSQPSHTITCSMFPWDDRGDGHPSDTTLLNTLAPVLVAHGLLTHGTTKLPLPATKRTKN
ncbi:septin-11 [Plakobranchus ocellatus]|uniref:Septin-11 n=1 Tax=Plakobranchus ocellatus TaxID=259542 RepID=A0AAV3YL27_9GAST|nr:septin-11 [Plakobranchus ocellatus]